jgi:hypothetical protein
MNGRDKITIVMIVLILSGIPIATLITIKDYDQIISQFNDFINDPFSWNEINEGTLRLYFSGYTVDNSSPILSLISESTPPYDVYSLSLIVNYITIRVQGESTVLDLIQEPIIIDLKALNNTIELFDAIDIPEGVYSAVHFYYDSEIIADTSQGNKTFNAQGNKFFVIPFFQSMTNNTQAQLRINNQQETDLLLSFQMQIRWQTNIIFPHIFGYLSFSK